ncbi:MAG: hypothetical protein JO199_01305 [Candidatus Eremiobacteraeota bacterium]|nr:hypothetical protein [Candidatus Eremiobacteraeota bacterium]
MIEATRNWRLAVGSAAAALALCACNSGGTLPSPQGAAPAVSSSSLHVLDALQPRALSAVNIYPGAVNGQPNLYNPKEADYPNGGQGSPVDGVPCSPNMVSNEYHIHVYLGIIYRGNLIADPMAIGMVQPGPPSQGYVNSAQCYYELHTHDSSGLIHVEAPRNIPMSSAVYYLRNILDIWGVPYTPTSFGPFQGPLHVFVGNVPLKTTVVKSYTAYTQRFPGIRLRSHEVIWIEIGSPYYTASQLPEVEFYTEY